MRIRDNVPMVVFDDRCYLCTKFAEIIKTFSGKRINFVGHYSETGKILREQVLGNCALEMFWFIDGKTAFGGRAGLIPLFFAMISRDKSCKNHPIESATCNTECKNVKSVFLRSASLLTNSKKIKINERKF